jgi:hypothetical protein
VAEHCPGCQGYTADGQAPCPGLPAPEAAPADWVPLDMTGHETWIGRGLLPGRCHCRIGKPHEVDEKAGYDRERGSSGGTP